ncbi:MAG: hypothetical protein IPL33_20410 [Sphingobacteriales bacterium]|nr:hypothetical protein [Sphingobacteriales bacterium]
MLLTPAQPPYALAREIRPNLAPRHSMRVMDGCVLLAVVFALMRSNFTRYEALNHPFAISRLT